MIPSAAFLPGHPVRVFLAPFLVLLLAAAAGAEEIERSSVPVRPRTEAREGWRSPGFRMELQPGYQLLSNRTDGDRLAPSGNGISLGIEPGLRLSRSFALSAGLRYALVPSRRVGSELEGYEVSGGLSWTTTLDVTWFPVDQLFLGAGAGYGGMLTDCHATGVAALVRAGAQLVVTDLFAMGPLAQVGGTVLGCGEGRPARLHDSVFLAWAFAWR